MWEWRNGNINRLLSLAVGLLIFSLVGISHAADPPKILVYKSPTCSCCEDWIDHLKAEGFDVTFEDRDDMDVVKAWQGVPQRLGSCHTALVDGYVIEGHVPAADIKRLLAEKLKVVGLSAPGMPQQAPGMQDASLPPKNYDIISFDAKGQMQVFSRY
jgi:hypothetical protein